MLLLFNVLGFYGVFYGLQLQNDHQISLLADQNSENLETITIKIPMAIPYGTDQSDFERAEGAFEYQGQFFRLIQQRFDRDTLHLVCVRDVGSKQINDAFADFVKTFTDKPFSAHHQGKHFTSSLIKEYIGGNNAAHDPINGWSAIIFPNSVSKIFIPAYTVSILHPPERFCS